MIDFILEIHNRIEYIWVAYWGMTSLILSYIGCFVIPRIVRAWSLRGIPVFTLYIPNAILYNDHEEVRDEEEMRKLIQNHIAHLGKIVIEGE